MLKHFTEKNLRGRAGCPRSPGITTARSNPLKSSRNHHCIKGLILSAGGDIPLTQSGEKPFQFMFIWQMQYTNNLLYIAC